jgi:hypothetical protein
MRTAYLNTEDTCPVSAVLIEDIELTRVASLPSGHGSIVQVLLLAKPVCRLAHPNGRSTSNHMLLTSLESDLMLGGDFSCILSSAHSAETRILAPQACTCLEKHNFTEDSHTLCTILSRGISGYSLYGQEGNTIYEEFYLSCMYDIVQDSGPHEKTL